MAGYGGPVSTLPGALLELPPGSTCDNHPDRLATKRVQGETDSYGHESIDMCDECYSNYKNETAILEGSCEHCGAFGPVVNARDPEEGSCGRVYRLCQGCKANMFSHFIGED